MSQPENPDEAPFVDVCSTREAPPGTVARVHALGRDLLIANVDGRLHAFGERCTHAAWSLADGELRGCEIVCALHGARFDLRTGEPTAPPASKPLQTFPVRTLGDRVEVQVTPPPR